MSLYQHTDNAFNATPNMGVGAARHTNAHRLTRNMAIKDLKANEAALAIALYYERTLSTDPAGELAHVLEYMAFPEVQRATVLKDGVETSTVYAAKCQAKGAARQTAAENFPDHGTLGRDWLDGPEVEAHQND